MSHAQKAMTAQKAPLALRSTAGQLTGFQRMIQVLGKHGGQGAVDSAMSLTRALTQADDALGKVGTSLGGVAKVGALGFASAIGAVAVALGAASTAAVYFGAKVTAALAKAAVAAYDFRERTLIGMEVMLKSGSKAAALYGRALKFAFESPLDTATVVSGFQKLLARGFKTTELERVMTAVTDLNTVMGGTTENAKGIMLAFGQIKAKPFLSLEELNQQLSERGLPIGKVMETIGKMTGKTVTEVDKAIRAGKISSKVGMEAILKTIEQQFGGASKKMMPTLSGMWNQLAGSSVILWSKVFEDTDGGMSKFMGKLKGLMKGFTDSFFKVEGEEVKLTDLGQRVVGIVDRIGKAWDKMLGNVDQKQMGDTMGKVLTIVERVLPLLESFGEGFKKGLLSGLGPLLKGFDSIDGSKADDIEKMGEAFKLLGGGPWVGSRRVYHCNGGARCGWGRCNVVDRQARFEGSVCPR